jgi:short-subunit dehydrogenase
MENSDKHPLAIITAASSGIGYEFARQFAENGFDLVIVDNLDDIFNAQNDLETYGTNVTSVLADLSTFHGVENLYRAIKKLGQPISVVLINAGGDVSGEFTQTNLKDEVNLINLNITSVVHLTKKILPDMIELNEGRILFTASDVISMPVYNASKAFLSAFAESLSEELKNTNLLVTFIATEIDGVNQAFEIIMTGEKKNLTSSLKSKVQGWANRILPESMKSFH